MTYLTHQVRLLRQRTPPWASFDSCPQDAGAFFTVKFSQTGTYKYHCRIHAAMHGEVRVVLTR